GVAPRRYPDGLAAFGFLAGVWLLAASVDRRDAAHRRPLGAGWGAGVMVDGATPHRGCARTAVVPRVSRAAGSGRVAVLSRRRAKPAGVVSRRKPRAGH